MENIIEVKLDKNADGELCVRLTMVVRTNDGIEENAMGINRYLSADEAEAMAAELQRSASCIRGTQGGRSR